MLGFGQRSNSLQQTLQKLNLAETGLTVFPATVNCLQNLKYLNLDRNCIQTLGDSVCSLHELSHLMLNECGLTTFPMEIAKLCKLNVLHLSGNKIGTIPKFTNSVPYLEEVCLDRCDLDDISALFPSRLLRIIRASGNRLTHMPENAQFSQVEHFILSHNQITSIAPTIGQLQSLSILDLSHNKISQIDAALGCLINLRELNLSNNQISDIPITLTQLKDLRKLNIAHNEITSLPNMSSMWKLRVLVARHNKIQSIEGSLVGLKALTNLDLSSNCLGDDQVQGLNSNTFLQQIILSDNRLTFFNVGLGQLQYLSELRLDMNEISKLDNSILNLVSLTTLVIDYNATSELLESDLKQQLVEKGQVNVSELHEIPTHILEKLYFSSTRASRSVEYLRSLGISYVTTVEHVFNPKKELHYLELNEYSEATLDTLVRFVKEAVSCGSGCLITSSSTESGEVAVPEVILSLMHLVYNMPIGKANEILANKVPMWKAQGMGTPLIHVLLNNQHNRALFKQFCVMEQSDENIRFWESVKFTFCEEQTPNKRYEIAKELFSDYISSNGSNSLNIDSSLVEELQGNLKQWKQMEAPEIPDTFFTSALQQCERNMMDTAVRFQKHTLYQQVVKQQM